MAAAAVAAVVAAAVAAVVALTPTAPLCFLQPGDGDIVRCSAQATSRRSAAMAVGLHWESLTELGPSISLDNPIRVSSAGWWCQECPEVLHTT